jgi:indole-3-glycerol phosphate synthase
MSNILNEIAAHKKREIELLKESLPLETVMEQIGNNDLLDFRSALINNSTINIIAEIKKASPSKGILLDEFDPEILAAEYRSGGAAALSVLTDERYFHGSPRFIEIAKDCAHIPVLCKEFIVDEYQIYYARLMKADAVLLIVRLLEATKLKQYLNIAKELNMSALVEVHDDEELQTAIDCGSELIGVNNRNLDDFTVSLEVSERLAPNIPNGTVKVAESGLFAKEHVKRLKNSGYNNFLIGEALVKSESPVELLKALREV